MKYLPDVTLVVIDGVAFDLSVLALRDTLGQIQPAEVLVWAADIHKASADLVIYAEQVPIKIFPIEDFGWSQVLWGIAPAYVQTSHLLTIQWDGWVLDGAKWQEEFLKYDYIGAPWPWHKPETRVGNGGFSLRSTKLMRQLMRDVRSGSISPYDPEDDCLCSSLRAQLALRGFVWAPQALAEAFAFERSPRTSSFGFHGAFNFTQVLSGQGLVERVGLGNDYTRSKSEWAEMLRTI